MPEITINESTEKIIKIITGIFSAHAVYQVYHGFNDLKELFTNPVVQWTLNDILFIVKLVWLPIAVFLFSKHYKAGWILLMVFIVFYFTSVLISAAQNYSEILGGQKADNMIGTPLIVGYVLVIIGLPVIIYYLIKKQVRTVFKLSKEEKVL